MPTSPINSGWQVNSDRRARSAGGFTLLELLVVIALAMIALTAVSVSIGGPSDDRRVANAARQIANGLNYAHSLTARRGANVDFLIDPVERVFWIDAVTGPVLVRDGVALRVRAAREVLGEDGTPAIRFLPDGSATGGRIELIAGRASRTIEIDWLTGLVSIVR